MNNLSLARLAAALLCACVLNIPAAEAASESVLHSFQNGSADGRDPRAGVTNVKGTLYGTTSAGGSSANCGSNGCGTVFEITLP